MRRWITGTLVAVALAGAASAQSRKPAADVTEAATLKAQVKVLTKQVERQRGEIQDLKARIAAIEKKMAAEAVAPPRTPDGYRKAETDAGAAEPEGGRLAAGGFNVQRAANVRRPEKSDPLRRGDGAGIRHGDARPCAIP